MENKKINYILVVDDSKTIAKGLKKYIESIMPTAKCLVAFSKADAELILQKYKKIECALLDLHLPDAQNGEIVDFVYNYHIPIVVLTGKVGMEDKIDRVKIVDYVIKDGIYSFYYASNIAKQIIKNKNIKALVVDDSKVALEKTAYFLRNYNLKVLTASNCLEAQQIIKDNQDIKIIYTDYNMPIVNGLELIRELRKKYSKKELSIVVISSQTDSKTSSTLLKYGANDFLQKDYNAEEFYARLNINLEILELFDDIERQYQLNLQKDKIIQEQNKMSAMTELIKNISHHWRQPLSAISANADSLKIDCEFDMLDPKEIPQKMDSIITSTQFLAKTIETFREIISENVEIKEQIIQDEIKKAINVQQFSLTDSHIKIIEDIDYEEPIKYIMPSGDLNKVLIYLINNAHDILQKKDTGDRWIKVFLEKIKNGLLINIEDNGGGIPDSIKDKIFEPYFTTKHQSPGTGLGLHMALKIVQDNLHGKLYATNTNYGAKFTIELSLNQNSL
jgi:signal transduction histidine kinase